MSDVAPAPFDAWIAHWLHDEPELRLARVFAGGDARRDTLFAIEREIAESVYGVRDASVAQARIGWWMEECAQLAAHAPRHPLTRELETRVRDEAVAIASAIGRALTGAVALVDAESIATVDELVALDHATFAPMVRIRARRDVPDPALRAATGARLLLELRDWQRFAQPARARVPLQVLAGAGVDRTAVAAPGAAAAAAQGSIVSRLAAALGAAPSGLDGLDAARVVVARRLASRRDVRMLGARADGRLGLLLALWRQARSDRSSD